jgi:hypothetical protein
MRLKMPKQNSIHVNNHHLLVAPEHDMTLLIFLPDSRAGSPQSILVVHSNNEMVSRSRGTNIKKTGLVFCTFRRKTHDCYDREF